MDTIQKETWRDQKKKRKKNYKMKRASVSCRTILDRLIYDYNLESPKGE